MNPSQRHRLRLGLLCTLLATTIAAGFWVRSQIAWLEARRAVTQNPHIEIGPYAIAYAETTDGETFEEIIREPAPWPLSWLGEQGCVAVFFEQPVGDDEVARVRALFPEADVQVIAEALARVAH